MKRVFAVVLALVPMAHAAERGHDAALSLGNIRIADAEQHVRKALGEPVSERNTGEGQWLDYDGLSLWTGQQSTAPARHVYEILSTSPKYCTPAGLCPGMPMSRARAIYGKPTVADREDGRFFEYGVNDSECWYQLTVKKAVIKSIRLECVP